MATELSRDDLKRFARLGAMRRLEELQREEAEIRAAFPDLFRGRGAAAQVSIEAVEEVEEEEEEEEETSSPRGRRRSKMSPAARRAVSERMKKYWAERRKAKASRG